MSLDDFVGAQMLESEHEPSQDQNPSQVDGVDASRGPDLSSLLGSLFGQAGAGAVPAAASGLPTGFDLGGLAGRLLGGASSSGALDANNLAEQSGLPASVMEAAVPLVVSALVQDRQQTTASDTPATRGSGRSAHAASLGGLVGDLIGGKPFSAQALEATGLPQELASRLGLGHSGAIAAILAILKALGIVPAAHASGSHAKPKPKPRPHANASAAKPKAKPKPASGAAKPRPATPRRPRGSRP